MSFIQVSEDSDFPIQNLPYGVFKTAKEPKGRIGVAIGDQVLNLFVLSQEGFFNEISTKCFEESTLNAFMGLGRPIWKQVRKIITELLSKDNATLRDNEQLRNKVLIPQNQVTMILPAHIGDYTDFYASREHAINIGSMWRGKDNALMPNWLHIPIGYHGRSSSIIPSGTPVRRPKGQTKPVETEPPIFGPAKNVDFELEVGVFVGPGNELGDPISIDKAEDHLFGIVLLNDWSARDIQKWEYQPLGPFCAKNWATTISPWVITFEALEEFRVAGPVQEPIPLPYLQDKIPGSYDIQLNAAIQTSKAEKPYTISKTNFKFMYWSMKQQIVHHSCTGCNMQPGDLLGSGTISGPTTDSLGSMVEMSWGGQKEIPLADGETRKLLVDGDTVILTGFCQGKGYRIGFGQCSGKLLPAHTN